MTAYQVFNLPRQLNISSNLTLLSGAKALFELTGTSTPSNIYQDSGLTTPHTNPVEADSAGVFPAIYLDPTIRYRLTLLTSADVVFPGYPLDDVNDQLLSQAIIGDLLYPSTAAEIAAGVIPTSVAYEFGRVSRWGSNQTVLAAIEDIAAEVTQLTVTVDVAVVATSNITIPSNVILDFVGDGGLAPATGVTVTVSGTIRAAPSNQIFSGLGTVALSKDKNPEVWANWFKGSDIGAQINNAYASAVAGPITIRVAPSTAPYAFATTIDFSGSESVRLTGPGSKINTANNRRPNLAWSADGTDPLAVNAIDFTAANGFELDGLTLTYTNAAYAGNLIKVATDGSFDPAHGEIHHCSISGTNLAESAVRLIQLAGPLNIDIHHNYFRYAVAYIGCSAGSNNVISIRHNWLEKEASLAHIVVRGGAWSIEKNVSESGTAITKFIVLGGETNGLTIQGNMCIDGQGGGGTMIDLSGSDICTSVEILGNSLGAASGTGILLSSTAGNTSGVNIHGNNIVAATGVNMAAGKNIDMRGNKFQCTTPWTGTNPTRYCVGPNDYNGTATSGIPVANDDSLILASTNLEGSGLIAAHSVEDNAIAIYSLNGSANTTTEFSDPASLFTTSQGSASSINIYNTAGVYRLENKRGAGRTVIVTPIAMGR